MNPILYAQTIDCLKKNDPGAAIPCLKQLIPELPASLVMRGKLTLGFCMYATEQKLQGLTLIENAWSREPGIIPAKQLAASEPLISSIVTDLESRGFWDASPAGYLYAKYCLALALLKCGRHSEARLMFIDIIRRHRSGDISIGSPNVTEEMVRSKAEGQPIWHSIDLGGSLFVEGIRKNSPVLAGEIMRMDWPDLRGKSVLDIGAWGGFYSFEAERYGASAVTALDYYSWITDFVKLEQWVAAERAAGRIPDAYNPPEHVLDRAGLPGRKPFDIAREALHSKIQTVCADFRNVKPEDIGQFDIVLFLGVLYHLVDPWEALQRVFRLCKQCAVVETLGFYIPEQSGRPLWEFYRDDTINNDVTTWWAPSEKGLADMLRGVGFSRVEIKSGNNTVPFDQLFSVHSNRIIAHAWK
jgi:tRNA (mo5U34)-methyltransferase